MVSTCGTARRQLPEAYMRAIDGAPIGERRFLRHGGLSRRAGHHREYRRDPLWTDYRQIALAHGSARAGRQRSSTISAA
jgi:hypothetical protein